MQHSLQLLVLGNSSSTGSAARIDWQVNLQQFPGPAPTCTTWDHPNGTDRKIEATRKSAKVIGAQIVRIAEGKEAIELSRSKPLPQLQDM